MTKSPTSVIMLNDINNTPTANASPALTGSDVSDLSEIWRDNHPFYGPPEPTSTPSTPSHVRTLFEPDPLPTGVMRELAYEHRIDQMLEEINHLKRVINDGLLEKVEDEIEIEERFNQVITANARKVRAVKRRATEFLGEAMLCLSRAKTAKFLGNSVDSHMDEAFDAVSAGLDFFLDIKKEPEL